MRISTNMIYQKGVAAIQQQTSGLLNTQQQVSTGRRILTPADDPIASARALELGQSKAVNSQFALNIGYADDNMKLLEGKLIGVGDILHYTRERAVQAGNSTLSTADLASLATDIKSQFEAMFALANSKDGQGDYIFSGYKAGTQPFSGNLSGVRYDGDQGGRTIQVSASRFMPISLPGSDVFDKTRIIDDSAIGLYPAAANKGSESPTVSLADATAVRQATRYQIEFSQPDPAIAGTYTIERWGQDGNVVPWTADELAALPAGFSWPADGSSVSYTPDPLDPASYQVTLDGLNINLPADPVPDPIDAPQEVRQVKDEVTDGDRFEIYVASTNMLDNLAMFAVALEKPGASRNTGAVAFALDNLDAAQENVLRVRAQIGSQMVETQQLANLGSDLNIQYAEAISRLEDVDYAEAISRLTQQQTYLQAAQQSFMRVTGLSLFNYLN